MNQLLSNISKCKAHQVIIGIKVCTALLLIGCVFSQSRSYLQCVRLFVFTFCIWQAYVEYQKKVFVVAVPAVICAVLLNPIIKFRLLQAQWLLVYAVMAIALIVWIVFELYLLDKQQEQEKQSQTLQ